MVQSQKGKFLYEEERIKPKSDHFTLVFAFSRAWCVYPIFNSLNKMKIPLDKCHLLVYDNSDNKLVEDALMQKFMLYKGVFASMRIYKSYRKGGKVLKTTRKARWEDTKLVPIMEMYKEYTKMIKTEVFINIEDDTICPPDTVMKLLETLEKYDYNAFVTGIECSRDADRAKLVQLGVYYLRWEGDKLVEKCSLSPKRYTKVRIDACGHYCFATTRKIWDLGFKGTKLHYSYIKHFAIDVFHTARLSRLGIPVIADFSIRCAHIHPDPHGTIFWRPSKAVPMLDVYLEKYGVWAICIPMEKEVKFK